MSSANAEDYKILNYGDCIKKAKKFSFANLVEATVIKLNEPFLKMLDPNSKLITFQFDYFLLNFKHSIQLIVIYENKPINH